jgi:hypothetical protein
MVSFVKKNKCKNSYPLFFVFLNGLIVSSDLPDRKKKREKGFASGRIVLGDLPDRKKKLEGFLEWSHFSRRPAR